MDRGRSTRGRRSANGLHPFADRPRFRLQYLRRSDHLDGLRRRADRQRGIERQSRTRIQFIVGRC